MSYELETDSSRRSEWQDLSCELERLAIGSSADNLKVERGYASGHLMCRTSLWGIAGFLGCAYFAWTSFAHFTRNEFEWPHDGWTVATYLVWIILLCALTWDTRCLRERVFFGLLVTNFGIGLALTLWKNVSATDVRTARLATGALWALAAVASLATVGRSQK